MGTTLDNGIYLPDEGERNCYDGLAGNWVALDNHLGSTNIHVTINDKQAWNGHVADTTIHVTSADKQAWNSHVADTTIHVTSADKQAWNGHIADSVKHVTAEDKQAWNGKADASALTAHTGNTTIHVTAEDKNKWDAVTSKADDSDVVHKSGKETINGVKTFSDNPLVGNGNTNITISNRQIIANGSASTTGNHAYSYIQLQAKVTYADSSSPTYVTVALDINEDAYADGKRSSLSPSSNNVTNLGKSGKRWANVYATNYYYGSSETEFSTKFVTTDTAQTVSGRKIFNDINTISSSSEIGVSGGNNSFRVLDKNQKILARIDGGTFSSGMVYSQWLVNNGTDVFNGVSLYQPSANLVQLRPQSSTLNVQLGASNRYFTDCYTSKINGLTPSSLSLPSGNANDVIDISSYITALDGTSNSYTVPANGWISIAVVGTAIAIVSSSWSDSRLRASSGDVRMLYPVLKNETLAISVTGTTLTYARFIPCQGNV